MQGVGIIYHREIGTCTSNYRFWLRGVNSDGSEVGPIWGVFAATLTVFLRQFRLTVTVPRRLVRTRRLFRFLHVCQYVSTFYWHNLVCLIIISTRISNSFPLATLQWTSVYIGAFCQFPLRLVYYCHSSKSTGEETGKTDLCAVLETYMWQHQNFRR